MSNFLKFITYHFEFGLTLCCKFAFSSFCCFSNRCWIHIMMMSLFCVFSLFGQCWVCQCCRHISKSSGECCLGGSKQPLWQKQFDVRDATCQTRAEDSSYGSTASYGIEQRQVHPNDSEHTWSWTIFHPFILEHARIEQNHCLSLCETWQS